MTRYHEKNPLSIIPNDFINVFYEKGPSNCHKICDIINDTRIVYVK